jgi:cellobiose phosphorylase
MVTMQLCYGCREIAELARQVGDNAVAEEASQLYQEFKKRLNEVAWDGEWYVRTICGDGYRIGSKDCKEGQIYLNPQSWAVLSGVADEERARLCMSKIDEILETDLGYRICYPPYAQYDPRVGRMSNSMPGANENGGCYNHAAGFKGVADCLMGRHEQAWKAFVKVTPDNPENPVSNSGSEPFSYVNSYSSVPYVYGQSGYAWRTGTSGWFAQLLLEYVLGARRGYEGLVLDPCLPRHLERASVTRRFRGATYHISLDNTSGNCTGTQKVILDGQELQGPQLPDLKEGEHQVQVTV